VDRSHSSAPLRGLDSPSSGQHAPPPPAAPPRPPLAVPPSSGAPPRPCPAPPQRQALRPTTLVATAAIGVIGLLQLCRRLQRLLGRVPPLPQRLVATPQRMKVVRLFGDGRLPLPETLGVDQLQTLEQTA